MREKAAALQATSSLTLKALQDEAVKLEEQVRLKLFATVIQATSSSLSLKKKHI
jgi:hypothetical protein